MKAGEVYRHSKSGNLYRILHLAKCSETLGDLVVYTPASSDYFCEKGSAATVWVRPAHMWNEIVEIDGKSVPRFVLIT